MTDKNADVVLTVVLTTAAEYSTLWEEKAKAATGNDYSHRMMKAQTLAMADLCALLAERNELQKQTLDAMTEQTGEMKVRSSIALDALNLEKERWAESQDTGRLAAKMLAAMGAPVCDSDALVHGLLAKGGAAVPAIAAAFPGVVVDGAVDRRALGAAVFGNPPALARLEAILHPMVKSAQRRFLGHAALRRVRVAVLDIPLLFETKGERRVDATLVVSAPFRVQKSRVQLPLADDVHHQLRH